MQFTSTTVFAIMATLAIASPLERRTGETSEPTSYDVQGQCGSGQKVSCCNSGLGNSLLAANCVQIPVLNLIPISQQCQNDNVVACCNTQQSGLANVNTGCMPVNLDVI